MFKCSLQAPMTIGTWIVAPRIVAPVVNQAERFTVYQSSGLRYVPNPTIISRQLQWRNPANASEITVALGLVDMLSYSSFTSGCAADDRIQIMDLSGCGTACAHGRVVDSAYVSFNCSLCNTTDSTPRSLSLRLANTAAQFYLRLSLLPEWVWTPCYPSGCGHPQL